MDNLARSLAAAHAQVVAGGHLAMAEVGAALRAADPQPVHVVVTLIPNVGAEPDELTTEVLDAIGLRAGRLSCGPIAEAVTATILEMPA